MIKTDSLQTPNDFNAQELDQPWGSLISIYHKFAYSCLILLKKKQGQPTNVSCNNSSRLWYTYVVLPLPITNILIRLNDIVIELSFPSQVLSPPSNFLFTFEKTWTIWISHFLLIYYQTKWMIKDNFTFFILIHGFDFESTINHFLLEAHNIHDT